MSLFLFIAGLWAMVLAVAAFLIVAVAPIDTLLAGSSRIAISAAQAVIAIASVALLAFGMSRLKRAYLRSKLQ
ncbi:MAG: hypothetical protein ABI347_05800 [Nitrososphaera sp.]|jgi:hypothetical protein